MKEKDLKSLLGRDREKKEGENIGLLSRFFAFLVDVVVLTLIFSFYTFIYILISDRTYQELVRLSYEGQQAPNQLVIFMNISFMVLILCYFTFFDSRLANGASPGKRTLQIEVLNDNSKNVGLPRSFLRNIARISWFLPLWLIPTGGFIFLVIDLVLIGVIKKRVGDLLAGTHLEIY